MAVVECSSARVETADYAHIDVIVKFFFPAQVYQYDAGFARFCNVKYSSQAGELNNPFIHLTNVAIQKHNDDYNVKHGGKWNLQHVRLFVEATWGREASAKLFDDIDRIIIHSLKAVQGSIINDRHCFECYGYDILIDAHLKPWLVEVNASPSLSTTTHSDRVMKMALIRDVLDVVLPKDITNYRGAFTLGPCEDAGGFSVLYDEALEAQLKAEAEQAAPNRGAQRRGSQAGAKQAPSRFF
jgi:tubulin polyglutamylase TTLL1